MFDFSEVNVVEYDSDNEECTPSIRNRFEVNETTEKILFNLQDKFLFVRRIHTGNKTTVYEAIERETNTKTCLKVYIADRELKKNNPPAESRVLYYLTKHFPELQINHLNWYMQDFYMYVLSTRYVGEYIDSSRIKTLLSNEQLFDAVLQLMKIISTLHKGGVMHRDIKPSNVLYNLEESKIYLCDFGASTFTSNGRETHHSIQGTDGFFAPEMETEEGYSNKADIWSAGILIGTYIFGCGEYYLSDEKVASWILECKGKTNPSILESILIKMLEKDPEKRPSATECVSILENKDNI